MGMPTPSLRVQLPDGRAYPIHFLPFSELPRLLAEAGLHGGSCIVVTDENVGALHLRPLEGPLLDNGWRLIKVVLPPGEGTKALAPLETIYDRALAAGIDRQTPLLALGGGVIGDLAGYAAATLLRGLPLVQLPTSLLAQVDSAIGGKTGVNHPIGKNLIGAFHQPRLVCADLSTLVTLPDLEWHSGLSEVVKHALIADPGFATDLERDWQALMAREPSVTASTVQRAAAIKAMVVAEDEREAGLRAILNFGHTFGHAIERVAGYGRFSHGEAVAIGMLAALHASARRHADLPLEKLDALVHRIPVRRSIADLEIARLMDAMRYDKKVRGGQLRLVLLRRLGQAYVADDISAAEVVSAWETVR